MKKIPLTLELIRISWRKNIEFSFNFVAYFFVNLINLIIQILFWNILINRFGTFKSWGIPEMIVLNLFTQIFFNFNWGYNGGSFGFWRSIFNGELDLYLCKPVSPSFFIVGLRYNIMPLIQSFLMTLLLFGYLFAAKINFSLFRIVLSLMVLILAVLIIRYIYLVASYGAFWIKKAEYLSELLQIIAPISKYPTDLFTGITAIIITYILPIAYISTIPTQILLNKLDTSKALFVIIIEMLLLWGWHNVHALVWRAGLSHYESSRG